jgi:hypothetical protein
LQPQPVHNEVFPERYKFLAVAAFDHHEIGDSDLAYYLRCDIARARELAAITLSSRELDSSGELSALRLDFDKSLLSATP